MDQAAQHFENHTLHVALRNLKDTLRSDKFRVSSQPESDFISKVRLGTEHIQSVLKNAIPSLVQPATLDALTSDINSMIQQLSSYSDNSNAGHLRNAANQVDQAVNQARNVPVVLFAKGAKAYSTLLGEVQTQAEGAVHAIAEDAKKLRAKVKESSDNVSTLDAAIKSVSTEVEKTKNQLDVLNTKFQAEHDVLKEKLSGEANALLQDILQKFEEQISEQADSFEGEQEKQINNAQALIKELEEKREQASRLVEAIGNTGVTGNYQKRAEQERTSANSYRSLSILFWVLLILTLLTVIFFYGNDGSEWYVMVSRLIVGLFFALPASYAARESSKHRKLEGFYRQRELELASLEPYIELMTESEKLTIKKNLAEKYFGQDPKFVEDSRIVGGGGDSSGIQNGISAILDILKKK